MHLLWSFRAVVLCVCVYVAKQRLEEEEDTATPCLLKALNENVITQTKDRFVNFLMPYVKHAVAFPYRDDIYDRMVRYTDKERRIRELEEWCDRNVFFMGMAVDDLSTWLSMLVIPDPIQPVRCLELKACRVKEQWWVRLQNVGLGLLFFVAYHALIFSALRTLWSQTEDLLDRRRHHLHPVPVRPIIAPPALGLECLDRGDSRPRLR